MTRRAMASAVSLCATAWVGGIVISAAGYQQNLHGPWIAGAFMAGLAAFGGAFLWGRSVQVRTLERRLRAAERVCQLVGMTGADCTTERGKARTQAWQGWSHTYGHLAEPVSDVEITALAARRDEIRRTMLARLEREGAR